MLSLSTSWGIGSQRSGREIIDAARGLGFEALELNYQFPKGFLKEIFNDRERGELKITSLHNICPFTKELACYADFFKRFNFSSPKKEIIKKAIEAEELEPSLEPYLLPYCYILILGTSAAFRFSSFSEILDEENWEKFLDFLIKNPFKT